MEVVSHHLNDPLSADFESGWLRSVFVLSTLPYPLWHLIAPRGATHPWIVWWLVAGSLLAVGIASLRVPFVERNLLTCFHGCSALVTLHMYLLAYLNAMYPLYAVGSALAVVSTLVFIRTVPILLAYSGLVVGLGALLTIASPDLARLAYWGWTLPACALFYLRLAAHLNHQRVAYEYRTQLEQQVAERTGDLAQANRRLHAEIKERERVEADLSFSQKLEVLGRMAGAVAHDFNNLLTAIRINADLLLDSLPAGAPQRDDVERIQRSSDQAARLIGRLLTFARGSTTAAVVADLREVIVKSREIVRHLVGEDTEVVYELDSEPQPIGRAQTRSSRSSSTSLSTRETPCPRAAS